MKRRRMLLSGGLSADPVLENNDWATISKVARAGKAAEFWKVGDLKNITVGGVTYAAQIIGFDHDDVTDPAAYGRVKAGITFQLQNCYGTKMAMNSTADTTGGWASCALRNTLINTIYPTLETELKNAIITVNKLYGVYIENATPNVQTLTSADELFLLSLAEVKGLGTDGSQYEYYAAGNSTAKYIGTTDTTWWVRSRASMTNFGYINTVVGSGSANANKTYGVAFGFCV